MITISLNGKRVSVSETRLKDMMISQGYHSSHMAVAINGTFVPKSAHETLQVNDGDEIDIVAPMQGG